MSAKAKRTRTPGAVAKIRALLDEQPRDAKRKAFLDQCERLGINRNTAKTQWQNWRETPEGRPQRFGTAPTP